MPWTRHDRSDGGIRLLGINRPRTQGAALASRRGVAWVKLTPEVRRKIYVAYRRGERNHPTIKVFVEEIVRTASRLLGG
jgi:DNA-binding transcriptional LysR family regulator